MRTRKNRKKTLLTICVVCLVFALTVCDAKACYVTTAKVAGGVYINIIKNVTVRLRSDGGTMPEDALTEWTAEADGTWTRSYEYESSAVYGELPQLTGREGYAFSGWYTEESGGMEVTAQSLLLDTDAILYAHWVSQKTFRVTLDAKGGTFSDGSETASKACDANGATYGDWLGTIPTREGYDFMGWYTDKLPYGYYAMDYLESTGRQAIDTGIRANEAYGFEISFIPISSRASYQAYMSSVQDRFTLSQYTGITSLSLCKDEKKNSVLPLSTTDYNVISMKDGRYTFNGTDMGEIDTSTTPLCSSDSSDIYICTNSTNNRNSSMKLKYVKLYDQNGNLLRDMTPCCKTGGKVTVCGLYDWVAGKFYADINTAVFAVTDLCESTQITPKTAIGTTEDVTFYAKWRVTRKITLDAAGGTFENGEDAISQVLSADSTYADLPVPVRAGYTFAGWTKRRLPAGYTEVEYLEGTGTQWIDTGIPAAGVYGYEMMMEPVSKRISNQSYLAGTYNTGLVFGAGNAVYKYQSKNPEKSGYLNISDYNYIGALDGKLTINEVEVAAYSTDTALAATDTANVFLFNNAAASRSSCMQLKYAKLYGAGNTLLRDLIPCCKQETGEYGLYDMVSGTFYGSDGSGAFIAGDAVAYDVMEGTDTITQGEGDILCALWAEGDAT